MGLTSSRPLYLFYQKDIMYENGCAKQCPSNAHDFIYFLRPEVLTGASNLGGIKLSTTNQYLLLTIISYYKLLLTIINYYYLLLTIINHYITIR